MWLETEYHWHFSVGSKCLEKESTWEEEQKKALWLWIAQALWDNSALAAAEESWIQVSVEAGKCFLWEHSQGLPKVLLSLETCLASLIKGAASSQQSHKLLSWTSRTDVWGSIFGMIVVQSRWKCCGSPTLLENSGCYWEDFPVAVQISQILIVLFSWLVNFQMVYIWLCNCF